MNNTEKKEFKGFGELVTVEIELPDNPDLLSVYGYSSKNCLS